MNKLIDAVKSLTVVLHGHVSGGLVDANDVIDLIRHHEAIRESMPTVGGADEEAVQAAHRAFDNAFCAGETSYRAVEEAIINYKAYLRTPSPLPIRQLDTVAGIQMEPNKGGANELATFSCQWLNAESWEVLMHFRGVRRFALCNHRNDAEVIVEALNARKALPIGGEVDEEAIIQLIEKAEREGSRLYSGSPGSWRRCAEYMYNVLLPYFSASDTGIPADALIAAGENEVLADRVHELEEALRRTNQVAAHWRKVAYDGAKVTEEEVEDFLRSQALGVKPQQEKSDE